MELMNNAEEMEQLKQEGANLRKYNPRDEIRETSKEHYEDLRKEFISGNNLTTKEMSIVNRVFGWLKIKA